MAASSQPALAEWVTAIREVIPDEETRAAETEVEPVLMCGYVNKMGGSRKVSAAGCAGRTLRAPRRRQRAC